MSSPERITQQQAAENADAFHATRVAAMKLAVSPGLPVAGYKPVQPAWAIEMVNQNKILEEKALRQLDAHVAMASAVDQRAVAIARTQIQDGFMWLNRAVFQPSRLEGDL